MRSGCAKRIAHPQAGQRMALGEAAGDDEVVVIRHSTVRCRLGAKTRSRPHRTTTSRSRFESRPDAAISSRRERPTGRRIGVSQHNRISRPGELDSRHRRLPKNHRVHGHFSELRPRRGAPTPGKNRRSCRASGPGVRSFRKANQRCASTSSEPLPTNTRSGDSDSAAADQQLASSAAAGSG